MPGLSSTVTGTPVSRRALTTSVEEATHKPVATTLEEREVTEGEMNVTTGVDQLATLMEEMAHRYEDDH